VGLNGWRSVDYKFNVIFKSKFDNEDFAWNLNRGPPASLDITVSYFVMKVHMTLF
jgi:hypothetical protein